MKLLTAMVTSFSLLASGTMFAQAGGASASGAAPTVSAQGSQINITRSGSQPSGKGPAENFTGSVRIDPLFRPNAPSRTSGSLVTFEPGARTAWHKHSLGQTLVVTTGAGWVQEWGGEKREIKPGDVVWIPAGVKHWHGATATNGMSHIAISEQLDGKGAEWMEKVSDEQYRK